MPSFTPALRRLTSRRNRRLAPRVEVLEDRRVMDATYHNLLNSNFTQDWTNTGLITANDNWSGVPSVIGFLGQDITTATGTDPQTLLGTSVLALDLYVLANQTSTTISNGGVIEFEITNPTIGLNGSGTADAPYILIHVNSTGVNDVRVQFNARDLDGSADNSIQPIAVQYRVGESGNFTNLPSAFIADASTGPTLASLVTAVDVTLPAAANNQSQLQIRVITANAVGNDEAIGIDDIVISGTPSGPLNQPPVNTVPAGQVINEDSPLAFTGPLTISVADPDAGTAVIRTSVTVSFGTLTASAAGSAILAGSGSAGLQIDGSVDDINATLASLVYQPDANFFGTNAEILLVSTNDLGNTGLGTPKIDNDTVAIDINPVADTPSMTSAGTSEDTQSTSGLVISRNPADNALVTHFKITNIQSIALFQNDGVTPISEGSFITFAQGNAGLRFTPLPNINSNTTGIPNFGFNVQASLSASDAGLGGALLGSAISVNAVNDEPSFTPTTTTVNVDEDANVSLPGFATLIPGGGTDENSQTALDYLISNITNPGLFTTPPDIANNGTLTFALAPNASGSATFDVAVQDDGGTVGGGDDTSGTQTITINVAATADTPSVTNATTNEDIQTTSGLVISRNAADGLEVTHFKITNIQNGVLYLNNGTTEIFNGDFITFAQGNAGLKFTPAQDLNSTYASFSFDVQASLASDDLGLGGGIATATITVNAVNDAPSFTLNSGSTITVDEDSGPYSDPNFYTFHPGGGADEAGQTLLVVFFANYVNSSLIQGNPGLGFDGSINTSFAPNAFGTASVDVIHYDDGGVANGGVNVSVTQTITYIVSPVADTPSVTNATTDEDTQTTSGLVITRNAVDGAEVTHFQITNITGGTLFQNDGTTPIADGDFITFAQGNAGLKFTPDADLNSDADTFSFDVQASLNATAAGLGGGIATATITVDPVNDEPSFTLIQTTFNGVEDVGVTYFAYIENISAGAANESGQTLTFTLTPTGTTGNLAFSAGPTIDSFGNLDWTPASNTNGSATFDVVLTDDGGTANGGDDTSITRSITIVVDSVNDRPTFTIGSNQTILEDAGPQTVAGFASNFLPGPVTAVDEASQTLVGYTVTIQSTTGGLTFTSPPAISNAGQLTYTVAPNSNGSATISVVATDSGGAQSLPLTFAMIVTPVNDEPSFTLPSLSTTSIENQGPVSVPGFAVNISTGPINEVTQAPIFQVTVQSTTGTLAFTSPPSINGLTGQLSYTTAANTSGTAQVQVILTDNGGTANGGDNASPPQVFTITVLAVKDFGDAPDSYGTLLFGSDGPRHRIGSGLFLGSLVDTEADGVPDDFALGDDNAGSDDEDGVVFDTPLAAGLNAQITVTASAAGLLDGWIDFNGNGAFDANEQIAISTPLVAGPNVIRFAVPVGSAIGVTYARFRVSAAGGLGPTGDAPDGEVEDYCLPLTQPAPGGYLNPTLADPSKFELVVFGGDGNDRITLSKVGANAKVQINRTSQTFPLANLVGVRAHGRDGNDTITGQTSLALPLTIFGDAGNDTIRGGNLGDVLFGGDGNDTMYGNRGRDILIGGAGRDTIRGGADDDLLIGGTTDYDADPVALAAIRALWIDTAFSYFQRSSWVRLGLNQVSPPLGAANFTDSEVDTFFGEAGNDFYYTNFGDKLIGKGKTESQMPIGPLS